MVYIYLADGFEEVEALTIVDVLRRAGVTVRLVSIMNELTVTGAHDVAVVADTLFEDADCEHCEMLILPGGGPGSQRLLSHAGLKKALTDFAAKDKPVAAICAAPMVLARAGLLNGKKAVIYDGMEAGLAGAVYVKENVVQDGNIITSRGPGTAMAFALKLAELLAGQERADKVRSGLLY
jgi:4-methyl-5(b-hydroxyethyl)-thiazole monophosphate biosynthesis